MSGPTPPRTNGRGGGERARLSDWGSGTVLKYQN